jgi:hypothetical protein
MLKTLFETFKAGKGVTLAGFGGSMWRGSGMDGLQI